MLSSHDWEFIRVAPNARISEFKVFSEYSCRRCHMWLSSTYPDPGNVPYDNITPCDEFICQQVIDK